MIRQLKKRVFLSIFLPTSGILLAILLVFNAVNALQIIKEQKETLQTAAGILMSGENGATQENYKDQGGRNSGHGGKGGHGKKELLKAVSYGEMGMIQLGVQGDILTVTGLSDILDEEIIENIIEKALEDDDRSGTYRDWIYLVGEGNVIFVLNTSSAKTDILMALGISFAGFIAAVIVFSLLADWITKRVTAPVESAMQSQNQFISDASHELKTPLTVINANADVLEKSIGKNKWLDYIREETERMAGLVSAMLELSRFDEIEGKELQQEKELFNVAEAVEEAVLPLESVVFEKEASLDMNLNENISYLGNRKALTDIIKIFMDNALKHTDPGGIIRIAIDELSHNDLRIHVSNTGEGIDEKDIPHIFERFYKADQSRKYAKQSYGLGLAIAKAAADKEGWSLCVSSLNGWTTFEIRL